MYTTLGASIWTDRASLVLDILAGVIMFLYVQYRYRIQYESLLQVEKEQNEFFEDFGIK